MKLPIQVKAKVAVCQFLDEFQTPPRAGKVINAGTKKNRSSKPKVAGSTPAGQANF